MSDLYLILHKVRGEPAFDIATRLQIADEEGWIIPTSGHRAYPKGVPGQGLGKLNQDIMAHELLPHVVSTRNMQNPRKPSDSDRRSMELGIYSGQITSDILKSLGY